MVAKVVPAIRLPAKASETYDYSIPEAIAPAIVLGAVVIIPFAGRKIAGLVVAVSKQTDHQKPLKPIIGFAQGLSPLPAYVFELWKTLAENFATTLPRFAWTALPTVPSRSIQASCVAPFVVGKTSATPASSKPAVVFVNEPADELTMVRKVLSAAKGRQVLVLVPTVFEAQAWAKSIGNSAIYHGALATGAKYNLACATCNGTVSTVIGTKSAVFLPWHDLFAIVILSAGSASHLQEDSDPRFDARVVAEELAKATGARLVALDVLPPLGMTSAGSGGRWEQLNSPRPVLAKIYDLHDAAKAARSRVLISEGLESSIDEAVSDGKRVLILLNKRGVSTAYVCQACGESVSCPSCKVTLTVHSDRQSCPACDRLYPLPEACPKCASGTLKAVGSGSKTLYAALAKRHPMAKIVHIDSDTWSSKPDDAQIVVGTTAIFRALPPGFKPFDLAADALLGAGTGHSGIWSVEEAGRILRSLSATVGRDGSVHIQAFDATSPALKALADPSEFLLGELAERKAFGYPPARKLVTIYGAHDSEETVLGQATALGRELAEIYPDAEFDEPAWSRPKLFRKKFRLTITAKLKPNGSLAGLARRLPPGFAGEAKSL